MLVTRWYFRWVDWVVLFDFGTSSDPNSAGGIVVMRTTLSRRQLLVGAGAAAGFSVIGRASPAIAGDMCQAEATYFNDVLYMHGYGSSWPYGYLTVRFEAYRSGDNYPFWADQYEYLDTSFNKHQQLWCSGPPFIFRVQCWGPYSTYDSDSDLAW